MGKTRGRKSDARTADMTILPDPDVYKSPARSACEVIVTPAEIDALNQVVIRQDIYKGKIVNFAFMQQFRDDEHSPWLDVARVDCCHSEVHVHYFGRSGEELERVALQSIPHDGWEVVDGAFNRYYGMVFDEWEANHERWRQHG